MEDLKALIERLTTYNDRAEQLGMNKTLYYVTALNLYALASTLVHNRIPFEFCPTKAYNNPDHSNHYKKGYIRFALLDGGITIEDIKRDMEIKYNDTFKFNILQEKRYE